MKPVVDKSKCISCGACVSICPEVFFMDDDGFAEVKRKDDEGSPIDFSLYAEKITEAIGGCPNQAISDADADEAIVKNEDVENIPVADEDEEEVLE